MDDEHNSFDIGSSEDSIDELNEIESRLYSVIHYNNLSEMLPEDLPDGFEISCKESNQIIVKFNQNKPELCNDFSDNSVSNKCSSKTNANEISVIHCSSSVNNKFSIASNSDSDNTLVLDVDTSIMSEVDRFNKLNKLEENNKLKKNAKSDEFPTRKKKHKKSKKPILSKNNNNNNNRDIIVNNTNMCESNKSKGVIIISDDEPDKSIDRVKKIKSKKMDKDLIVKNCPKKWSSAMIKYYTKVSSKKLKFNSDKLIKIMRENSKRSEWFVNNRDLRGNSRKRIRCYKCRQFGHDAMKCTEPVKPILCHMCGEIGHDYYKCPRKMCLTCGRSNGIFVQYCRYCLKNMYSNNVYCEFCKSNSHNRNVCPGIWRSFHLTTSDGPMVIPLESSSINIKTKYCCNCAKQGHLDDECEELNFSSYINSKSPPPNYFSVSELVYQNKRKLNFDIKLDPRQGCILSSEDGYSFLQRLSNISQATFTLAIGHLNGNIRVSGTKVQCEHVFSEVLSYVNSKESTDTSFH